MDEDFSQSEMAKPGSILCLPKRCVTNALISVISCVIFVSLIYLLLTFLHLASLVTVDSLFHALGYISLLVLFSAPIGIYGAAKSSYCALFTYLILASYHLYGLILYICLNLKSWTQSYQQINVNGKEKDELILHKVTSGAYATVLVLTLIMTSLKIVSTTNQIEPNKVIVVDNNPLD